MDDLDRFDPAVIRREAEAQLQLEAFNALVQAQKALIQRRQSFWSRIFPWTITITRKQ